MTVEAPAAPILLHPIGVVRSPYRTKDEVPKGLGARHDGGRRARDLPRVRRRARRHRGFLAPLRAVDLRPLRRLRAPGPEPDRRPRARRLRDALAAAAESAGASVVELLGRDGAVLRVRGVDMLDGSPVVDLKPYLSSVPPEKLRRGWLDAAEAAAKSPG